MVELLCHSGREVQMLVLIILHNYDCSAGGMCVHQSGEGLRVRVGL